MKKKKKKKKKLPTRSIKTNGGVKHIWLILTHNCTSSWCCRLKCHYLRSKIVVFCLFSNVFKMSYLGKKGGRIQNSNGIHLMLTMFCSISLIIYTIIIGRSFDCYKCAYYIWTAYIYTYIYIYHWYYDALLFLNCYSNWYYFKIGFINITLFSPYQNFQTKCKENVNE